MIPWFWCSFVDKYRLIGYYEVNTEISVKEEYMSLELEIKMLIQAAESRNLNAMLRLANIYEQIGTDEALKEAEKWRSEAGTVSPADGK